MEIGSVLKSDIFFFVATLAVIAVSVVMVVAGVYAIKIMRDARWIVRDLKWKYRYVQKLISLIAKK